MTPAILAQVADTATAVEAPPGFWDRLLQFIDTPAPYSPFSEYLLLLFVLWLVARISRRRRNTFSIQAQDVLDEKYEKGELSRKAYDKFRQDISKR